MIKINSQTDKSYQPDFFSRWESGYWHIAVLNDYYCQYCQEAKRWNKLEMM